MLLESLNIFFILLKKISWCSSACVWCSILIFMKFKERNNRRGGMAYSSIKRWIVGFWSISQQKSVIDVFCKLELENSTCIMSSCWPPSFLILIYCKSNSFECRDQPTASSHTLWRIKHWCQSLTRFIAISLADKLFFSFVETDLVSTFKKTTFLLSNTLYSISPNDLKIYRFHPLLESNWKVGSLQKKPSEASFCTSCLILYWLNQLQTWPS